MEHFSRGTLVGRYAVEEVLGEGGFGVVYAAQDSQLRRSVALKILSGAAQRPPETLERFHREALAIASLPSEHVPMVFETGEHQGCPYIVMERLIGHDLGVALRSPNHLPVETVVDWILEALLGLAHAHARGIVHRDLKPNNLFLARRADGTDAGKLLDFGIVKLVTPGPNDLTESGALIGTPRYMAPEQLMPNPHIDARTDIWAIGVILYEMLTKSPLFNAGGAAFGALVLTELPEPPRQRRQDIPQGLEAVILRCLARQQLERYADIGVLAFALAPFATQRARTLPERVARVLAGGQYPSGPALTALPTARVGPEHVTLQAPHTITNAALDAPARPSQAAAWIVGVGVALSAAAVLGVAAAVITARREQRVAQPEPSSFATVASPPPPVGAALATSPAAIAAAAAAPLPTTTRRPIAPATSGSASISPVPTTPPAVPTTPPAAPAAPPAAPTASAPPRKRTAEEQSEAIHQKCMYDASRYKFLAPPRGGPASVVCSDVGNLGCAGLRARCAATGLDASEKKACGTILWQLSEAGDCS